MNHIQYAKVQYRMAERYLPLADELAALSLASGLSEKEWKVAWKFSDSEAANMADVLDYIKRRCSRDAKWRTLAPRVVDEVGNVRGWVRAQTDDMGEQRRLLARFVGMVTEAVAYRAHVSRR